MIKYNTNDQLEVDKLIPNLLHAPYNMVKSISILFDTFLSTINSYIKTNTHLIDLASIRKEKGLVNNIDSDSISHNNTSAFICYSSLSTINNIDTFKIFNFLCNYAIIEGSGKLKQGTDYEISNKEWLERCADVILMNNRSLTSFFYISLYDYNPYSLSDYKSKKLIEIMLNISANLENIESDLKGISIFSLDMIHPLISDRIKAYQIDTQLLGFSKSPEINIILALHQMYQIIQLYPDLIHDIQNWRVDLERKFLVKTIKSIIDDEFHKEIEARIEPLLVQLVTDRVQDMIKGTIHDEVMEIIIPMIDDIKSSFASNSTSIGTLTLQLNDFEDKLTTIRREFGVNNGFNNTLLLITIVLVLYFLRLNN